MRYVSTRGLAASQSFSDILLEGLASDGGLYMPAYYPQFSRTDLAHMRHMSYSELAFTVFSPFVDDIPAEDLRSIIDKTYTAQIYCYARAHQNPADITPILTLEPHLHLLGLSNGPTLAFKDMAMQLLGNLFEYVLKKQDRSLNILGATSGDTGPAAEHAMRGKPGVRVFMLSPHQKMSPFQTAQMFSLTDSNIFNIAIEGVFDNCQDIVKAVSHDQAFKTQYQIGVVNSINWARILAQAVYYFKAYFAVTQSEQEHVSFSVPSGNFGNVCAGHVARMLGLPMGKLIVATNENDVLDEFFRTGVYHPRDTAHTYHTSSPSMDISKASNFERFAFDLVGRDSAQIRQFWQTLDQGKPVDFKTHHYFDHVAHYQMVSGSSTHADRIQTIRNVYQNHHVFVDTHTADGLKSAWTHREPDQHMVVLETASAVKFEATIKEALGVTMERPDALKNLEQLPQKFTVLPVDTKQVKQFIAQHIPDA